MSNELSIHYPAGATLYVILQDATNQVWNGSAFAAPGSANWTDYDIAMAEVATSTGVYRASMPAAAAGVYGWVVRKQAGGSPAVSDITVGSGKIEWDGTAEMSLDGVKLAPVQGSVEFGQVKILADVADEGALHVVNSNLDGIGAFNSGGNRGQVNFGSNQGQINQGAYGQYNTGSSAGQWNQSDDIGQANVGQNIGQINEGSAHDVQGVDPGGIQSAIGMAADNLDAQLAVLPTAVEIVAAMSADPPAVNVTYWASGDVPDLDGLDGLDGSLLALEATAQEILLDTGTTLPALLAGAGKTAYSNTITDTGSNPLDGVEVWITSDSGGASTVASTTTNTLGAFTVYLDPGTYYLWLAKGGYNFPNPTTITVS